MKSVLEAQKILMKMNICQPRIPGQKPPLFTRKDLAKRMLIKIVASQDRFTKKSTNLALDLKSLSMIITLQLIKLLRV